LQDEGSDKYVRLIGFVPDEDLMKLYSQAMALVQPSHSEGFGLTGLEAMAAGLPVLASRSPVFQEIYADAALYFDAQSKDDLETVLQTILNDGKLRRRLIRKGLQRAKLFSWKTLVKQTLTGYRVALAQSGI
jgi:glycosyltransferase involved in cell wall biosynthesis